MPKSFASIFARFRFGFGPPLDSRGRDIWLHFRYSSVCFVLLSGAPVAQRHSATGLFDFLARGRADFIRLHFEPVFQLALTKNFYPCEMTADEIRFAQQLFVYNGATFK